MKKRAIDLYSGAGGMTQGLKQAGFSVVGAVELDDTAAESYIVNHPEVRLWQQDIRTISPLTVAKELRLLPGQLDLLAGCPPCQGFSSVRTLNGSLKINDPRNSLVGQFVKFALVLWPKVIMLENVPGLKETPEFLALKRALRLLGYSIVDDVIDAQNYEVPQRRKRLLMLATRRGSVAVPDASSVRVLVEDVLLNLPNPGESGDALHDLPENRSKRILELIQKIPKDGGSRNALPKESQLQCHQKTDGFKDVYGRMKWKDVAPTITGGCTNPSKGRFLHPNEDRAITLREAALLQSFPLNYFFSLNRGKGAAAEMIGNALPPKLVESIGRSILLQL